MSWSCFTLFFLNGRFFIYCPWIVGTSEIIQALDIKGQVPYNFVKKAGFRLYACLSESLVMSIYSRCKLPSLQWLCYNSTCMHGVSSAARVCNPRTRMVTCSRSFPEGQPLKLTKESLLHLSPSLSYSMVTLLSQLWLPRQVQIFATPGDIAHHNCPYHSSIPSREALKLQIPVFLI